MTVRIGLLNPRIIDTLLFTASRSATGAANVLMQVRDV